MTSLPVTLTINGTKITLNTSSRVTLADALRDVARLTGTHVACEHGVCGACTVIVDGLAVRSCLMLAVQAAGSEITTVEGLAHKGELSALQASFRKHHAVQCGFCTPGILTTMHALLNEEPDADEERFAMSCREISAVAPAMFKSSKPSWTRGRAIPEAGIRHDQVQRLYRQPD